VIVIVSAVFCYVIFNVYIMYMINRLFRVFHNCYVLHERLHLFRSNVEPVENMPRVDWNSLHIVETHDDEGRIALLSENQIYALLGLREEGTTNESEYVEHGVDNDDDCIRTSDVLPSEMIAVGSVSLCRSPSLDPRSMSSDARRCMAWLDAKDLKSVV
jgi:hypothetical protein